MIGFTTMLLLSISAFLHFLFEVEEIKTNDQVQEIETQFSYKIFAVIPQPGNKLENIATNPSFFIID